MTDTLLDPSTSSVETVADCVARLGTPPEDILNEWIGEAVKLTGDESLTSFDPDAEVWTSIRVGDDGRLAVGSPHTVELPLEVSPSVTDQEMPDSTNSRNRTRWVLAAVVGFALAGLGWLTIQPDSANDIAARSFKAESRSSSGRPSTKSRDVASLPSTDPIDESAESELELMIEDIDAFTASTPADIGVGLSLDAFLPPVHSQVEPIDSVQPNVAPGDLVKQKSDEGDEQPSTMIDNGIGESLPADLLSDGDEDDADLMAESDEQTTIRRDPIEAKVMGVALPLPPRQSDAALPESIALLTGGRVPASIELQMPTNATTDFQLQNDEDDVWRIVLEKSVNPIAKIFANDDSELHFQWLEAARQTTAASALSSGRLRTSDGDVVYLRPRLDTDPIKLTLAKRDLKLKWSLHGSVPPNMTQIRVAAVVPKDVQWEWIEPIVASSPRSTRGVAMIRLKTSDATAVVVRVDVKTTNSLSLRLRFGARLDPAMPWQWTDAKSIRESFEAVTKQLEVADAQLLNLDVAISRAKRMRARRQEYLLEEQRDRIDDAVANWTTIAKRLAELDQLVAFLDAGASLSPELVVRWDDGEQVILGAHIPDGIE